MASNLSANEDASRAGTALANWSRLALRVTLSAASGAVLRSSKAVRVAFERSTADLNVEDFALSLSIQAADEAALSDFTGFLFVILCSPCCFCAIFATKSFFIWQVFWSFHNLLAKPQVAGRTFCFELALGRHSFDEGAKIQKYINGQSILLHKMWKKIL